MVRGMSVWSREHTNKETTWHNADFMQQVVGAPGKSWRVVTPLCSSWKPFPMDDFIWWITEKHREQSKGNKLSGRWCAVGGEPHTWSSCDCVVTLCVGDTRRDQNIFRVNAPPAGCCSSVISALKVALNLQDFEGKTMCV